MKSYLIKLEANKKRSRFHHVLNHVTAEFEQIFTDTESFIKAAEKGLFENAALVFAVELDQSGINLKAYQVLGFLNEHNQDGFFLNSVGGIIVDGIGELFTKDMGRKLAFSGNQAGMSFPSKSLVEATGSLKNFRTVAKAQGVDLRKAYESSIEELVGRVKAFALEKNSSCEKIVSKGKSVLAIHGGNENTSNSLALLRMVEESLRKRNIGMEKISLLKGPLIDCRGCKYEDCLHFGENESCFYGGVIVDEVYPAILEHDVVLLVCPNYNDSAGAHMMAFINRLTSVFRTHDFSKKKIYAIIVSGYSGGDLVAQQIIGAMNMNKKFLLPQRFALIETANKKGEIFMSPGIRERAETFANRIAEN